MPNPSTLAGPEMPPKSGKAKHLVVFLHGLGADGNDLLGLAPLMKDALPDAHFASPNAPFACDMASYGYQWFGFTDHSMPALLAGVERARPLLDRYLDAKLAALKLPWSKLAVVGFSQGTMTGLHTLLRREESCAAIVGFSGALIAGPTFKNEIKSRPPVCLMHGDADMVVPFAQLAEAAAALRDAGVPVEAHPRPGLGHSIDPEGLEIATRFLRRHLS